jgi:hypothetical protein
LYWNTAPFNEESDSDIMEFSVSKQSYEEKSIFFTYKQLFSLLTIPPVRNLSMILLSGRVAFGALESVFPLKVIVKKFFFKKKFQFLTIYI